MAAVRKEGGGSDPAKAVEPEAMGCVAAAVGNLQFVPAMLGGEEDNSQDVRECPGAEEHNIEAGLLEGMSLEPHIVAEVVAHIAAAAAAEAALPICQPHHNCASSSLWFQRTSTRAWRSYMAVSV